MGKVIHRFREWIKLHAFVIALFGVIANSALLGIGIFALTVTPEHVKTPWILGIGVFTSVVGGLVASILVYVLYQDKEVTIHFEGLRQEDIDSFLRGIASKSHLKEPEVTNDRED